MGRPREHDERTAAALLDAAERIVREEGIQALSVRAAADTVGTTTRAVYSLFGSKDGLVVALGARAFDLLRDVLDALPSTADPKADLVETGLAFRRFVLGHPSLFSIGVQRVSVSPDVAARFRDAQFAALTRLEARIARLGPEGLGGRPVRAAAVQFHSLTEGLAAYELRGAPGSPECERMWRQALTGLVAGFSAPVQD